VAVIGEASETVTEGYVIHDARGAWLAENGDLAVCLLGLAPDRSDAEFSIMVPARDLVAPGDGDSISGYLVPPDSIASPCSPPPQGARAIPSEFVGAAGNSGTDEELYQGHDREQDSDGDQEPAPEGDQEPAPEDDQEPAPEDDQALDPDGNQGLVTAAQYMQRDAADPKIYLFEEPGSDFGATVIYRHAAPLLGGVRYTRLDMPTTESRPKEALFLLLPVTVAVDIVLIAGYIYLCAQAPGAC